MDVGIHAILTEGNNSPTPVYHPNTEVVSIATPEGAESPTVQSVTTERIVTETALLDPAVPDGQRVEGLGEGYERRVDETPLHTRDINEYK